MTEEEINCMPWTRDLMTGPEFREWLASREKVAREIHIATCEIGTWAAYDMHPYGCFGEPRCPQLGKNRCVRIPASRGWVHAGDLSSEQVTALFHRIHVLYDLPALDALRRGAPAVTESMPASVEAAVASSEKMTISLAADAPLDVVKALLSRRPPGATEKEWQRAVAGVMRFVNEGWDRKALAAGWSESELYRLPSNWHRLSEVGTVLLVGEWTVCDVTAAAIVIKPPWSESRLKLYRKDTPSGGNPRRV
jgi:hypothetical protein